MENTLDDGPTMIMQLPDDCLYFIFHGLESGSDKESFGLTCRRWLQIQNTCRRTLQFQCSFTHLSISSLSQPVEKVTTFHLHKLLNRFQQLQSLSLSGCTELPDSALALLQYYRSNLQCLSLDCCFGITDNGLSFVASGCPSLTTISLSRCNVTDSGLQTLSKHCLCLRDVDLSHCSLISDHGIRALSQNCRQLRAVRISYCKAIEGTGFYGCSHTLSYLEATHCKLTHEGVLGMVSGGGLEYLDLTNLSWCICMNHLAAFSSGSLTNLRILNFRLCRTIGDDIVTAIAKGCPLLQEWNLALCHEVKLTGWESIGLNCHNLERLHVNRCRNLCDRGLLSIQNGCKRLLIFYISPGRRLSSTAIEIFRMFRSKVKIIEDEVMCIAPSWAF